MTESSLIYLFFFVLIIIQSIAGVGVLVLGTPLMLLFNFDFLTILSILLPISILTSLINLIYIKKNSKKTMKIDPEIIKLFFLGTVPFVLIGLLLIKNFSHLINFKYLVSVVILISLILSSKKNLFKKISKNLKVVCLSFVGIVHGLTNSGGTLLSLFFSALTGKSQSRFNITFFYFFLASIQYIIFYILFDAIKVDINYFYLIIIIIFSVIISKKLIKIIDEKAFLYFIKILALISCLSLIFT